MTKADKKLKTRRERRFFPRPVASPVIVYAIGGVGALVLGAGAWSQWIRVFMTSADSSAPYATWLLAAGIFACGVAIWFGTSGEPTLRVGDGGVGFEKSGTKRVPWYGVESVTYDGAAGAVVVKGRDEVGVEQTIRARVASHPQAAAWIAREARKRVPAVVSFGDEVGLPEARDGAGERVVLEPLQVVGKRCAASGTIIAFEPDARLCTRCERAFHKDHVPDICECGASMKAKSAAADVKSDEPSATEPDGAPQESHA